MASVEHELDELLAEPIIHLMMQADGVDRAKIYWLLARLKTPQDGGLRDKATRAGDHPCRPESAVKVRWYGH
jgi:hypothetical protein